EHVAGSKGCSLGVRSFDRRRRLMQVQSIFRWSALHLAALLAGLSGPVRPAEGDKRPNVMFDKYVEGLRLLGNQDEVWCFINLNWQAYVPREGFFFSSGGGILLRAKERHVVRFDGESVTKSFQLHSLDPVKHFFHPNLFRIMRFEDTFCFVEGYYGFRE